jgi:isoleucyl-tRNA synthetase
VADVIEHMDAYDNFAACGKITASVDALSNWYVRRSRDRFWAEDKTAPDKLDAYWTLYESLLTTAKLVAPFVPFLAEAIWRNLAVAPFESRVRESVHLVDFPSADPAVVDRALSERMNLVREIVSLGRAARMNAKLKVRQPLAKVEVILADRTHQGWLSEHASLIAEELNVKQVEFAAKADQYISYTVLPDLKRLGPRFGKQLGAVRAALTGADPATLVRQLETDKKIILPVAGEPVNLEPDDVQIRLQAKSGWAAAQGALCVVVLSTELDEALIAEGLARDLVHAIQTQRKEMDCQYTDRIAVGLETTDPQLAAAIKQFAEYIERETLAERLAVGPIPDVQPIEIKLGAAAAKLSVQVVRP